MQARPVMSPSDFENFRNQTTNQTDPSKLYESIDTVSKSFEIPPHFKPSVINLTAAALQPWNLLLKDWKKLSSKLKPSDFDALKCDVECATNSWAALNTAIGALQAKMKHMSRNQQDEAIALIDQARADSCDRWGVKRNDFDRGAMILNEDRDIVA